MRSALLGMLALPLPSLASATGTLRVLYPRPESSLDARQSYPLNVLELALAHSGVDHRMQPSPFTMQQARSLRMLETGQNLDILWTVPTRERARALRMVPFPIDRGLIGWRVLLIHRGEQAKFAGITHLDQLAALRGGQGHDWPDLPVLHANGLDVTGVASYDGLFRMLSLGHIDYFPRSITEVTDELERFAALPIALEKHLLLHYASALCFFVHPHNTRLANAVQLGLERSLADGSLLDLFHRTYDADLADLALDQRTLLQLHNPLFPPALPLHRRVLWYTPEHG